MHLEIGVARADGTGEMTAETNHKMSFKTHGDSFAVIDFSVLEFQVEEVDVPLVIYFRGVNQTHDDGSMDP